MVYLKNSSIKLINGSMIWTQTTVTAYVQSKHLLLFAISRQKGTAVTTFLQSKQILLFASAGRVTLIRLSMQSAGWRIHLVCHVTVDTARVRQATRESSGEDARSVGLMLGQRRSSSGSTSGGGRGSWLRQYDSHGSENGRYSGDESRRIRRPAETVPPPTAHPTLRLMTSLPTEPARTPVVMTIHEVHPQLGIIWQYWLIAAIERLLHKRRAFTIEPERLRTQGCGSCRHCP